MFHTEKKASARGQEHIVWLLVGSSEESDKGHSLSLQAIMREPVLKT